MLAETLQFLFPDIDFLSDCRLQDDGTGPYIAAWYRPEPQPTQTELNAAELPARKQNKRDEINKEATRRILAAYPLEKQSSANLGVYPQTYLSQMTADIAATIVASNAACDAIDAAVSTAEIDNVSVNWPVIGV